MEVLESTTYFNRYGTRKKRVKIQGEHTQQELEERLIHDAPFGFWMKFDCVDEENKIYVGDVHEYWD
jgi:hypothetical protein